MSRSLRPFAAPALARSAALLAAAALAVAASAPAVAHAQEARKYWTVDTVTVSTVDPEQHFLTAVDENGKVGAFVVDPKTRIRSGGDTIALSELAPGTRIAVSARKPIDAVPGQPLVADSIEVVSEAGL